MVVLTTDIIITLVVIAVVLVLVLLILLICCLCRKCDQCAKWSRRRQYTREETAHDVEVAASRRQFDEIRQQHDEARDQIRAKYNLNTGAANTASATVD